MHSWEEYNEAVQKVIELMHDDYPNGYIMEINGHSAELKANISCAVYLKNNLNNFETDIKEDKYKNEIYEDISD
jgi:hypothetical protein